MQRLSWGFLLTPQLLCKTWEQSFPTFPIHEEQSFCFSVWIIIFFFRLRKTERREKENGWVTAVSLLKHSCPCPSNRILRACIQNLLQNKTETFKNNHPKWCFSFFFFFNMYLWGYRQDQGEDWKLERNGILVKFSGKFCKPTQTLLAGKTSKSLGGFQSFDVCGFSEIPLVSGPHNSTHTTTLR